MTAALIFKEAWHLLMIAFAWVGRQALALLKKIIAWITPSPSAPPNYFNWVVDSVKALRSGGVVGLIAYLLGLLPAVFHILFPIFGDFLLVVASHIPTTATGAAIVVTIFVTLSKALSLWKFGADGLAVAPTFGPAYQPMPSITPITPAKLKLMDYDELK